MVSALNDLCAHEESNLNYGIRNPVSCPLNDGRSLENLSSLLHGGVRPDEAPRLSGSRLHISDFNRTSALNDGRSRAILSLIRL